MSTTTVQDNTVLAPAEGDPNPARCDVEENGSASKPPHNPTITSSPNQSNTKSRFFPVQNF